MTQKNKQAEHQEHIEHEPINSCRIVTDKDYNIVAIDCVPSKEQISMYVKFEDLPMNYDEFVFEINNFYFINNSFIDKRKYNKAIDILKIEQEQILLNLAIVDGEDNFLQNLSDEDASEIPLLYKPWENYIGKSLKKNDRVQYDFKLWKVLQNISVVLENQPPSLATAALYTVIDAKHKGTLDDQIPANKEMEYIKGKYYIENESIYLMNREGMEDGQSIVLHYLPSELVGQYFEKVK